MAASRLPTFARADDLKYDLHVLLVNHGKSCPACAKAGSAKHRSAASSGAAAACPIAQFKPPPSALKPYPSNKQRSGKGGGKKAADGAAGSNGARKNGSAGSNGARKSDAAGGSEGEQAPAASGSKRRKFAAGEAAAAAAEQTGKL